MQGLEQSELEFLAQLPLLLNSSLKVENVVTGALTHLEKICSGSASTLYLLDGNRQHLRFWVSRGEHAEELKDRKIPKNHGMVGWVIENRKSLIVNDVQGDSRFGGEVVSDEEFQTKSALTVPLVVRGEKIIGAMQVINSTEAEGFPEKLLPFLEQCAHQISLALENALLYEHTLRQREQLEELEKRKGEILTLLAHEFRTPLNVIQTSSDVLSTTSSLNAEMAEQLSDALKDGVSRLLRLVSQVRNLSLVESEDVELAKETFFISSVLGELIDKLSPENTKREVLLNFSSGDAEITIQGDKVLITLALYNILANAIRFTPDGGKVDVELKEEADSLVIRFTDTGIGIHQKHHELIFRRFYEVTDIMQHSSGTFSFKSSGLGLGLPTAKNVIERHGGEITVESAENKGSCFEVRIPKGV